MHSVEPKMVSEMKELGYECYWIPYDYNKRKRGWITSIFKLYRLFKKLKPDILHTNLFDDSVPSLIASKLAGIKIRIITKQDTAFHWYYAPKAIKFDKLNNYLATHIIAVSEECKLFVIEKEKATPKKIHLIHHGINILQSTNSNDKYKRELKDQFNLNNKIVIGTIARLIDWKGHKVILEVAEEIITKNPTVIFVFTGNGILQPEIEKIIVEKKLSNNVVLTGYISPEKIPSLYNVMDIYLHAAHYEPFGFVIAEAMVNKVPVISTKTGAALDAITHKENGYLVDYFDIKDFVKGIEFMIQNDRKAIGEKGETTALRMYNFDKMWKSYIDLYKTAFKQN
jgi:glycosyltransferase involved in cell wall biosynthesis